MRIRRSSDPVGNRTYEREYRRDRYANDSEWRERQNAIKREWSITNDYDRLRDPEKIYARRAVQQRVADGRMERQPCEVCSTPDTHAHHDDYTKPLDVRWLCRTHHGEVHRKCA